MEGVEGLVEFDGEAGAMMDFAVPVQLVADLAEVVADAVDFAAHALAVVAGMQFGLDALEAALDRFQFVAGVAVAAGDGFVAEVAVPLPEAMDVGLEVFVAVKGFHRGDGDEAGEDGEDKDKAFHRCVMTIVGTETIERIGYSTKFHKPSGIFHPVPGERNFKVSLKISEAFY